ncbi:hypothetical protein [Nonomuraea sp. B1E8]|uniref:hypothetical protein n=1 Tax=unclassified Nonomuraea TaxID=2593643 RepID=UPI00325CD2FF
MPDRMSVDANAAGVAAKAAGQGAARHATAVTRLHDGLASVGPVGGEGSELAIAAAEFTDLLVEVSGRTAQAFASTAGGMVESVAEVRSADDRAGEASRWL